MGTMSLDHYWKMAQSFLYQSKELSRSKDHVIVGEIASAIIHADLTFNGKGSLNGWRYQNAVWRKKKIIKNRIREAKNINIDLINPSIPCKNDLDIEHEELYYILDFLPEIQKKCVKMYYLEGMKLVEISKELNLKISTVYAHMNNGINRLRKIYEKRSNL